MSEPVAGGTAPNTATQEPALKVGFPLSSFAGEGVRG